MKCAETRPRFSPYLDGAMSGAEMQELSGHMRECAGCSQEFAKLEQTRSLVSSLGPKQAPADLARRIKIAAASERSRRNSSPWGGYWVHVENLFSAFMFPATAGIFTAIIFFAMLFGALVPSQVAAETDVPTLLYTPPRLEMSDAENQLVLDTPLVVETYVDAYGRVENFRILSGRDDEQMHQQLNRALLFTVFAPAQSFGRPVAGRVIISFSHINVKG
ncbi:MAG: zf-HC2 domain-containing protein [Acidobacteriia bacterium]|nr:zf-HC2 domain-containing protein [Terriglobia bacterium]